MSSTGKFESETLDFKSALGFALIVPFLMATFISALLLFLIQPMFAKELLPRLGGTPAVWNTCMAFYQLVLLVGYAYAHLLTKIARVRWQVLIHLGLLLAPFAVLPVRLPSAWMPPTDTNPLLWLLSVLALCAGLPVYVVSTSSPLLLRWFSLTKHKAAADPYFLYAASNAGSLLGLLAYPLLVEPNLRLRDQSMLWAGGYVVMCLLFVVISFVLWVGRSAENSRISESIAGGAAVKSTEALSSRRRLYCVFLAFVPSSLLLGVTTYVSTDIASVPLLWVIPLALYLVSFIIVFSTRARIPYNSLLNNALPGLAVFVAISQFYASALPAWISISAHLICFFAIAVVCHGRLAQVRPEPTHLTEYFFLISLGGVLGGAFNAFVAPVLFNWSYEYQLVIGLALLLRFSVPTGTSIRTIIVQQLRILGAVILVYCGIYILISAGFIGLFNLPHLGNRVVTILICGIPLGLFARRPIAFALIIAALPPIFLRMEAAQAESLDIYRSFFCVHRVLREEAVVTYIHGTTVHGLQRTDPALKCTPLTYFHPTGPAGQVLEFLNEEERLQRVAVMGLGTGTLGCYAQPGQEWVFYEIDPLVKDIATGEHFTFLSDCIPPEAQYRIILGDARLRVAEARDGYYDLIILDAFSSDAIPVHLITREAFQLYQRKLAPNGVILMNISSRFFDFAQLVGSVAHELSWKAFVARDFTLSDEEQELGKAYSEWAIIVGRASDDVEALPDTVHWERVDGESAFRIWTDDYSSILSILRWFGL